MATQLSSLSTNLDPYSRIFGSYEYQKYVEAEIGPVPPIPNDISLEKSNELDPCDSTKTKVQNYYWMYSPSHFEIIVDENSPLYLDKPDDLNDENAPRLRVDSSALEENIEKSELKPNFANRVLKVPNTINNLAMLFNRLRNKGSAFHFNPLRIVSDLPLRKDLSIVNPLNSQCFSIYQPMNHEISQQYGDKRIPVGWFCMREKAIAKNLSFAKQQSFAKIAGVIVSEVGHRILLNFLVHAKTNKFIDKGYPTPYARTSTIVFNDLLNTSAPLACGKGLGLRVFPSTKDLDNVGICVALPVKV